MKAFFLALGICLLLAAPLEAGMRFESDTITLTTKLDQPDIQAEFKFSNDGKHPLVIGRITTSCGCTTALSDAKVYLPGEDGKITVIVKIGAAQGRLDKTVAIETNDSDTRSVKLTIHVLVPQLVTFAPDPYVRWDLGSDGKPQTVSVFVAAPFPVRIVGLRSWHDKIKATLKEVDAGKKYEITVTPDDTKDEINTAIELLTQAKWPGEPKKIWLLVHVKPKGQV